jgi:hypothetical protein
VENYHSNKKPFSCPEAGCEYRAKSEDKLENHLKSKRHAQKKTRSETKGKAVSKKSKDKTRKRRKKTNDIRSGKTVTCRFPGCFKKVCSKQSLAHHFIRAHTNERNFPCPEGDCDYRGKTVDEVRRHCRGLHHERMPGTKIITCPHPGCGKQSGAPEYIKYHIRHFHNNVRLFHCPESRCDYAAKTQQDLNKHLKTGKHKQMISCEEPGCDFKSVYKKHVRNHLINDHDHHL